MSPVPSPSTCPRRRAVLERLARPLLARFLATHAAEFCAAHGVSLSTLAASAPGDRAILPFLFTLLTTEDATPPLPALASEWLAPCSIHFTDADRQKLEALCGAEFERLDRTPRARPSASSCRSRRRPIAPWRTLG